MYKTNENVKIITFMNCGTNKNDSHILTNQPTKLS